MYIFVCFAILHIGCFNIDPVLPLGCRLLSNFFNFSCTCVHTHTHTHTHTRTYALVHTICIQRVEEIMQRTRAKGEELKDKVGTYAKPNNLSSCVYPLPHLLSGLVLAISPGHISSKGCVCTLNHWCCPCVCASAR